MIYEELSIKELKELCAERNLGTGRSKGELINRLYEADKEEHPKYNEPQAPEPVVEEGVFKLVFEMYGRELTDELHLKCRLETFTEAVKQGHEVLGGAYGAWRIGGEGGNHVYGIRVRVYK